MDKNIKNYKCFKKNRHGITMMETIVALSILIMGIVSALTLMTSSIRFSQNSEESIIVVNLARENIEFLRSMRNSDGFDALTAGSKIIKVNPDESLEFENVLNEISACDECRLYLSGGRYKHDGLPSELTKFRRMITISNVTANEKKVISQVYWTERGNAHTYLLEDYLTNW